MKTRLTVRQQLTHSALAALATIATLGAMTATPGARAQDMMKFDGSVGWRTLTWPKASRIPSRARMRLASTRSR